MFNWHIGQLTQWQKTNVESTFCSILFGQCDMFKCFRWLDWPPAAPRQLQGRDRTESTVKISHFEGVSKLFGSNPLQKTWFQLHLTLFSEGQPPSKLSLFERSLTEDAPHFKGSDDAKNRFSCMDLTQIIWGRVIKMVSLSLPFHQWSSSLAVTRQRLDRVNLQDISFWRRLQIIWVKFFTEYLILEPFDPV